MKTESLAKAIDEKYDGSTGSKEGSFKWVNVSATSHCYYKRLAPIKTPND